MTGECAQPECEQVAHSRGLCRSHYMKLWRYGDPSTPDKIQRHTPDDQKFWSRVRPTGFCWDWCGSLDAKGYGKFYSRSGSVRAHRYSWEFLMGSIPQGLMLDHLCRNTGCVNPDHLEPVTNRENMLRGWSPAAQTRRTGQCRRGHSMADAYESGSARRCKECHKERVARYLERKRSGLV